jgi:hypothetical protein
MCWEDLPVGKVGTGGDTARKRAVEETHGGTSRAKSKAGKLYLDRIEEHSLAFAESFLVQYSTTVTLETKLSITHSSIASK